MADLAPETVRRLALIRLLLARAEDEARQSPPFSTDSVNRLHDVAEMFLALAAQELGVAIPKEFVGYWESLQPKLGRPLAYRAQMQKVNKIRVNLKHYGVEPAPNEIEASRAAVRGLILDETPALFGAPLEEVSLANFVSCATARALLDDAEKQWAENEPAEAFADLAQSFDEVIRDYGSRKLVGSGRSVFDTAQDMRFLTPFFRKKSGKDGKFEEAVISSLKALDFHVKIIGLGVDLRRYGRFTSLCPNVIRMMQPGRRVADRPGVVRTQDDFEFGRDFVITTALHLAEFDYDFDYWRAYQEAARARREGDAEEGATAGSRGAPDGPVDIS